MSKCRQIFYIGIRQFIEELLTPRIAVAYMLGLTEVLRKGIPYLRYAQERSIQCFEVFDIVLSKDTNFLMYFAGALLILSSAPFVTSRSLCMISRTTRKKWGMSMILHMCMHVCCYVLFLLLVSVAISLPKAYIGNVWSTPFYVMARFAPVTVTLTYDYLQIPASLLDSTPYMVTLHNMLLMIMYFMTNGMMIYVFNLNCHKYVGTLVTVGIHMVGFLIWSAPELELFRPFSVPHRAVYALVKANGGSPGASYILFGTLIVLLYLLLKKLLSYSDFKTSIGGMEH